MSLTASERQALTWLLAVIGIGGGVRVVTHLRERGDASPMATEALRRQLVAVDSVQRTQQRKTRQRVGTSTGRRRAARSPSSSDTSATSPVVRRRTQVPTLAPVDVDLADSAALERLPRIGPSLAARIVADRARHGPFGSAEALQRVRGIGPKLAALLAPLVTFSGNPRPSAVQR